jgi:Xaa-Pro aminopeptidase
MNQGPGYESRRLPVRKILEKQALDGLLFTSLENIRYLCGFTGSDGAFLITGGQAFFLTDSRYWTQSEEEVKDCQIVHYKKKLEGILSLFTDLKLRKIGFESGSLTYFSYKSLSQRLAAEQELIPLQEEIKNLRARKDSHELALIRKAVDIASSGFEHIVGMMKEGSVERDIAFELEFFTKRQGSESMGFDTIIASGKRAALPHGKASLKQIEKGDFVLMDFGSMFQGYCSDETRTAVCGEPSSEQKKIYQIVKDAHDRAIEMVKPGVRFQTIDAAARDYIRDQGYGDFFGHGLGHGIGLAVHEDPGVNGENKDLVEEGMVFTIEPGIYLPDWGGVRIEDMVLATAAGAELLSYLPTDLQVI